LHSTPDVVAPLTLHPGGVWLAFWAITALRGTGQQSPVDLRLGFAASGRNLRVEVVAGVQPGVLLAHDWRHRRSWVVEDR
jgi:hypothetical protein